jgi:hypothetical protein
MSFKLFVSFLIIISRIYVGVRVISWIILKIITEIPHPLSEIEVYLVIMFLDIWVSSQGSDVIVIDKKTDELGS